MTVQGKVVRKSAAPVEHEVDLDVAAGGPRWVGRAAHKLDHAFTLWGSDGLTAGGRRCLDVGASTGGFTQVLLARGAEHVVALDVGHGQLASELRGHPDVTERSGTSVRDVTAPCTTRPSASSLPGAAQNGQPSPASGSGRSPPM